MTPTKSKDGTPFRPAPAAPAEEVAAQSDESKRKPWKKKTPVEIFRSQVERLRENVRLKEADLNQDKKQLQKLEEAIKLLESA